MRSFLLQFGLPMMWIITLAEAAIGVLALRRGLGALGKLVAAMSFGLAADALIQAAGVLLGEGTLLQTVSQLRYLMHGVLVPLMLPIAFYCCGIKNKTPKLVLWCVTGVIMLGGVTMGLMAKTEPVMMAGVLRYAQTADTPAFARIFDRILSIGGVIPVIVIGVAHLIRRRSPWLLLGGVVMFGFSALAPATHNLDLNFIITMVGELLMVGCFAVEALR